ncbi:MAG: hypothetical protein ACM30G_04990 [Micromonosporaceae bacterium]
MTLKRFEVVGAMPIRDAVTKESVGRGGVVTLDDDEVPRKAGKPLAATLIQPLLDCGAIRPVEDKKAEKTQP